MTHLHSIYDNDKHFQINPITREIINESGKLVLIQHDHNSERFTFEIPKVIDGHDMSLCNVVQVHYLNFENIKDGLAYPGLYEVEDLQVSPDSEDVVICSWLISGNATQYVGGLAFAVYFACVADDGTIEYAWNTAPNEEITVGDSIHNSDVVAAEYADILEKWRTELILANIVETYTPKEFTELFGVVTKDYVDAKYIATTAILGTAWTGESAPYTQEVTVAGILETDTPHITPIYSDVFETKLAEKEAWNMVSEAEAGADIITFTCFEDKPTVAITLQIEVNR